MTAALTFSRRKMFSKVRVTLLVPAPEEPVMAMMGWRSDMVCSQSRKRLRSENSGVPLSRVAGSWW